MSMDVLKNKIRKLRNPSALTIAPTLDTLLTRWKKLPKNAGFMMPAILINNSKNQKESVLQIFEGNG